MYDRVLAYDENDVRPVRKNIEVHYEVTHVKKNVIFIPLSKFIVCCFRS